MQNQKKTPNHKKFTLNTAAQNTDLCLKTGITHGKPLIHLLFLPTLRSFWQNTFIYCTDPGSVSWKRQGAAWCAALCFFLPQQSPLQQICPSTCAVPSAVLVAPALEHKELDNCNQAPCKERPQAVQTPHTASWKFQDKWQLLWSSHGSSCCLE